MASIQKKKRAKKDSEVDEGQTVRNTVKEKRALLGISQAELASQVGITRQALYAIETNRYLPSTSIALRLGRALDCSVEDLFWLPPDQDWVEAEWIGSPPSDDQETRAKLTQVGERLIARPIEELGEVLNFVLPADGLVRPVASSSQRRAHTRVQVALLRPLEMIQSGILIAGCDPAVFLAGEHVRHTHHAVGVTNWTMGSVNALKALQRGEVHMAGIHLVDPKSARGNVAYLKKHMKKKGFVGVHFANWVQGLFVRPDTARRITGIADLGKPRIRIVNREVGAGARYLLDFELEKAGIPTQRIVGYDHEVQSHLEVARLVRDGMADAGIGVEAVARFCGLKFIPLREEQYDFIVREDVLNTHPRIEQFLDAMVSRSFRQEMEALGGYNLTDVGKLLHW